MLAAAIIDFTAKEFGKKALWAIVNEYFPDDKAFETQVASSLDQLNRKIDGIGQDVGYLRIQPVKDRYIEYLHYFNRQLIPYLRAEAKVDAPHNMEQLKRHVEEVRKKRIKLGTSFEQGKAVFKERHQTCDFPVRTLFEILQNIAALEIVYLSWEYFLYQSIPDTPKFDIEQVQDEYKSFKTGATEFIKDSIDPLFKARMSKIHFFEDHKMLQMQTNAPIYVKYEYRDSFSSQFTDDPFKGDEIKHEDEVKRYFYDVAFWGYIKDQKLYDAYDNLVKFRNHHQEHCREVTRLFDAHVRVPTNKVLEKMNSLPGDLPDVTRENKELTNIKK